MTMTEVETKQRNRGGRPVGAFGVRRRRQQRFAHLVQSYSDELGGSLTEPEKALVAQISGMQIRIEQLQADIVEGNDVDSDEVIRLASEHRRLLNSLRSKAAKAKPSGGATALQEYLAARAAAAEIEDESDDETSEAGVV